MGGRPTVIDLFCGAGGLSTGFRQAGYDVLLGNDVDPNFGETYSRSHKGAIFIAKPIQSLLSREILCQTGLGKGQLDVLVGGPPCQGYSVYNHGRGEHDPRAGLFRYYLRIVEELAPKWIVMENVVGLLSISGGQLIHTIVEDIKKMGYCVEWRVLRAEDYGVPQERRRVVFIANRIGAPIVFPEIEYGANLRPFTTIWNAICDLPAFAVDDNCEYPVEASTDYQKEMRKSNPKITNHYGPKLGRINLERIQHIPQGGRGAIFH
jgi:DNA (cytosine-5)-methyltransferase 1